MSVRAAAISGLVVGALVLLVAWLFELPLGRVAVLAPAVVLIGAAVAGLVLFWLRAALEGLRESKRPRLIAGGIVALIVVGVLLTLLGIKLPHE